MDRLDYLIEEVFVDVEIYFKFKSILKICRKMHNIVIVNNQIVFNGDMKKIGGGGTKSAYSLVGTNKVVLLPNEIDGDWLVREFKRIRNEELIIHQYLKSKSIPSLDIEICDVFLDNAHYKPGIYCPSFESYIEQGAYILDNKNPYPFYWNKKNVFNSSFFELESWIPIFKPLFDDLKNASENGLRLLPYYDHFNLMITKKGSTYHLGEAEYAVRFFGFDFSSKRYPNSLIEKIQSGNQLEKVEFVLDIRTIVKIVFSHIIDYQDMNDEIRDFEYRLISYLENHE